MKNYELNHNLIKIMPSSLKFLYKKGKPKLSKKKNKVWSKAKRKGNRHVDRKMLDNMLSPVYSVSKKDYGYSNVFDDAGANTADLPDSGNLSSLQCLPGRQIYLEFNGLPIRPYYYYPTQATGNVQSTYRRTWSFIELLFGAYKRNRFLVQQSNQVVSPNDFVFTMAGQNFNLPEGADVTVDSANSLQQWVENVLANSAFNFKFCYMGGHQTHKFYNSTTLPVHGEIIEFMPRQCMNFDTVRRGTFVADPNNNNSTNWNVQKVPGMWQTLLADRIRLMNRETTDAEAGGADFNSSSVSLYNEIDDKNFCYKKGMEETNFRWVIGDKIKFTIYPGETFTYKMVLPPFSGDSFQFLKNVNRKWTNLGSGSASVEEWGNPPAFAPGFSKFCQIRMIGSRAYSKPRFADNNQTTDPNYVTDSTNDAYASSGAPHPNSNGNRPILHVATHSVRVTHTVTEHHSMRTFPTFDGRVHIFSDKTANASSGSDVTRLDQMYAIDVMENDEEAIPGDNHL